MPSTANNMHRFLPCLRSSVSTVRIAPVAAFLIRVCPIVTSPSSGTLSSGVLASTTGAGVPGDQTRSFRNCTRGIMPIKKDISTSCWVALGPVFGIVTGSP